MHAIGLELGVRCRACATPVAINALVPSATCSACGRVVELPPELWSLVMHDLLEEAATLPMHHERAAPFTSERGVFHRVFRRTEPACGACGAALAIDLAAAPGPIGCPSCRARVLVRRPPDVPAFRGVALVVGEDLEQARPDLAPPRAEARVLYCPQCGGTLAADGSSRLVTCAWCHAQATLPEEIFQTLHPVRPIRRFFLFVEGAAAPGASCELRSIDAAVGDEQGNLYCLGALDGGLDLVAFDAELRVRWLKRNVSAAAPAPALGGVRAALAALTASRARLAYARDGRLCLWRGKHVTWLRAGDGETERELDFGALPDLSALAVDVDGSLLIASERPVFRSNASHHLLLRYAADGTQLDTWSDARPPRELPLDAPHVRLAQPLPAAPLYFTDANGLCMHVGWDGALYLASRGQLAKIGRDGMPHWVQPIAVRSVARFGVDAEGRIHVLEADALRRFDRFGREAGRLAHRDAGGVLGDESVLVVAPEGGVTLLGAGGRMRRLGPDGSVRAVSAASRADDAAAG